MQEIDDNLTFNIFDIVKIIFLRELVISLNGKHFNVILKKKNNNWLAYIIIVKSCSMLHLRQVLKVVSAKAIQGCLCGGCSIHFILITHYGNS